MERSDLIIAVFFMTAFACSPGLAAGVSSAAEFPLTQEGSEPEVGPVSAPLAVAARHMRAGTIIQQSDIIVEGGAPDAVASLTEIIAGKELKRTIYAGKPLTLTDLGSPTVIKRNAVITIEFVRGPLVITTDGRALDPGGIGDTVRVMNLKSKIILSAIVVGANKVVTQ